LEKFNQSDVVATIIEHGTALDDLCKRVNALEGPIGGDALEYIHRTRSRFMSFVDVARRVVKVRNGSFDWDDLKTAIGELEDEIHRWDGGIQAEILGDKDGRT